MTSITTGRSSSGAVRLIMFTSGSTGEPKGVVITFGCVTNFLEWMLAEQALAEPGKILLNQVPFSFDVSVMDLYFSIVTGGTMFSITRDDIDNPKQLYQALARSGGQRDRAGEHDLLHVHL